MKVGLLTFHFIGNYGASLQCYALWRYLESCGHQVTVMDYRSPRFLYLTYRNCLFPPRFKHRLLHLRQTLARGEPLLQPQAWARLRQQQRTWAWMRRHIRLSPGPLLTHRALAALAPQFDALVVGSDQVWDITNANGRDAAYFLGFAPEASFRRIAYAVSAGSLRTFGEWTHRLAPWVRRFHHLSVRDAHTEAIVRREFGRACARVVDPVWLVDFAPLCAPRLVREDYLLFTNG